MWSCNGIIKLKGLHMPLIPKIPLSTTDRRKTPKKIENQNTKVIAETQHIQIFV